MNFAGNVGKICIKNSAYKQLCIHLLVKTCPKNIFASTHLITRIHTLAATYQ